MARFDVGKVLVTAPRLVAERVWAAEVEQWAHLRGLRVQRIAGTAKQRLAAMEQVADIYTISRDNVVWLEEQFIRVTGVDKKGSPIRAQYRVWPWDTVVLDESQSYMAESSKRFKSMRRLRRLFKRIYLLTGSFMPNGYRCVWSQMYLIDFGKRLGTSEDAYHKRWFVKEVNDGVVTYDLRPGAAEEIDRIISDVCCVMRDAKQVKALNTIVVTLDKKEQQLYSRMVRERIIEMGDKPINAVNAGVLWGKLLQLANGAIYDNDRNWHLLHTKKLEALVELMESLPRRVLIGYGFVHDKERILSALAVAKVQGVGVIRTNQSLDDWKSGKILKGVIHPASAGHGLNDLKDADAIVWFGMTPNREHFDQLNGRVIGGHRLQGRDVPIHVITTENTVDEDAVAMINFKGVEQSTAMIRVAQRLAGGSSNERGVIGSTAAAA
jgi:SNF2 family DNA or RNA helicase